MSSFPDVLSATLEAGDSSNTGLKTFTVPAEYAFAVVQVCFAPKNINETSLGQKVHTSHGTYGYDGLMYESTQPGVSLKDLPILNLIIKGGETFSLIGVTPAVESNTLVNVFLAKVTALCHKKPF